jgi:pimeloyl-ACP methyl ester carboxylesterase
VRVPSTDGVELEVHDLGGVGPPVLLCHATGFHGLVWRPLARHLQDRFRLWALDFRGHGRSSSPDPERGFAWEGFADDVHAVVDALELRGAAAAGHSKGGAALFLAESARPGTFTGLWCYEPIVFPPTGGPGDGESGLAEGAARRRDTFPSRQAAIENYSSKPPLQVLDEDALAAYVEHGFEEQEDGSVVLRCRPEAESQVYRMGRSHGGWAALPQVTCPTTVACGGAQATVGSELATQLAARLPAGRVEVFERLGHFGPLEDPAAVAEAVGRDLPSR